MGYTHTHTSARSLTALSFPPLSQMFLCIPQLWLYRWSPLGWVTQCEKMALLLTVTQIKPLHSSSESSFSLSMCLSLCLYQITITETVLFLVQYTSKEFDRSEKTVATGDCCYLNPLVRRTFRFLGEYM